MSGALILDTETTSIEEPEVIQLGFLGPVETLSPAALDQSVQLLRFKPLKKISLGAMATHHIIDADLEHEVPWPGSWSPPAGTQYLIGHNVDFDWKAIGSPQFARICTARARPLALAGSRLAHAVGAHVSLHRAPRGARAAAQRTRCGA